VFELNACNDGFVVLFATSAPTAPQLALDIIILILCHPSATEKDIQK